MKFGLKMTLCMLCLLALLFGAGGSLLIALSFEDSLDREEAAARESYRAILGTLSAVDSLDVWTASDDVSSLLDQLYANSASSWTALRFSSAQDVLYESGSAIVEFQNDRAGIDPENGALFALRDDEGGRHLQISGTCQINGEPYYLDAIHDLSPLYEARTHQQTVFRVVFLMLMTCCAGLAYGISWLLTRPLANLSTASRELASGNLSFRSNIRSSDEIGELSADFDAMAQQVEQSMEDLRHALERQERFMGSFAHEVKTPMTSIIGYADLLRRNTLTPDEQTRAAEYVFSEGKRLENLSRKLLDLFVLDKTDFHLAPCEPATLVQQALASVQATCAAQGIALTCRCEEGSCLIEADLVRSLLLNLIENARKAIDGPGAIAVRASMLPDGCRIVVEDNGKGIPADAREHLTEAFYRADAARSRAEGGAGLGLSLCAKIAELHHGSLCIDSEPGKGTRVSVDLKGGRS